MRPSECVGAWGLLTIFALGAFSKELVLVLDDLDLEALAALAFVDLGHS